jgi:hypothetical protein
VVRVVRLRADARSAISLIRSTSRGYGRARDITAKTCADHADDRLRFAQETGTWAYMPVTHDDWLGARLDRWARGY